MDIPTPASSVVIDIASGKLRGASENGVHRFKGIPYGAATSGAQRFMAPASPPDWTGIKDAMQFGPRAPQRAEKVRAANAWIRDTRPFSEDCLVLNVFTPGLNDGARRPIMVYIHGGGYDRGAGSAAGIDGSILARTGNVVVVTLNHRLGVFGFCQLGDLEPRFPDAGNAGMLDIVAALRWVRDHAQTFGGDAGNVTIFGQSGGASKVAVCMTMPAAKGLFHKAIMQSSSSHLRLATLENATAAVARLLARAGLDRTQVGALQHLSAEKLLAAYIGAVASANGNDSFRAVVDGVCVPYHPFDPVAPDLARDVPLLIGSCETEKSFYDITAEPHTLPLDDEQLIREIAHFVGIDTALAREVTADYRERRPAASGRDLFNIIASDHQYRRNAIEVAKRRAQRGSAPTYLYEFTWKTPVLGGMLKTPHTMCLPFVFGTTDIAKDFVGTGPRQETLTKAVMGAWVAFARDGNPNHADLPAWTPYDASTRPTMIFDNDCRLEHNPKADDLECINRCPPFVSDMQWPMP